MGSTGVIDHFLEVFTRYIDSGFGLLSGEVAFIATTLIVIDVTLAALFWSWGADDDIIARLVKKTLFVGVFAYIIGNWNNLAKIVFESFSGLGLKASGTGFSPSDLLHPGRVAQTGLDAGRPLLASISDMMGWISFFENFIQIVCMFFAWALVLLAFFILAIQLFVTLIEFKLTTLAGFVLIPFGLFGKSAFMAERVLGNVVSSGLKVLVLGVIVGIGSTLFSEFTKGFGNNTPSIDDAMAIVLAARFRALRGVCLFPARELRSVERLRLDRLSELSENIDPRDEQLRHRLQVNEVSPLQLFEHCRPQRRPLHRAEHRQPLRIDQRCVAADMRAGKPTQQPHALDASPPQRQQRHRLPVERGGQVELVVLGDFHRLHPGTGKGSALARRLDLGRFQCCPARRDVLDPVRHRHSRHRHHGQPLPLLPRRRGILCIGFESHRPFLVQGWGDYREPR